MLDAFFYILEIIFLLFGILIACQVFTNAIENLGNQLKLSAEFTGSILAAVGTALPETILPLIAIYMASKHGAETGDAMHEIAIGAIVGAPFMLATLAMLLLGISIYVHRDKRATKFASKNWSETDLQVNAKHLKRDLFFFLLCFILSLLAAFNFMHKFSLIIVGLLILAYFVYLVQSYKAADEEIGDEEEEVPELYLSRFSRDTIATDLVSITMQTAVGLIGIIYFAHHFVNGIEAISRDIHISPLILSLIISPIATELPEKINSWIWSSEGKDTLAMGNLSGAMVFQACIPCIIGILLTPWRFNSLAIICASLAIISSVFLFVKLQLSSKLNFKDLLVVGSLYLVYLVMIFV